MIPNCELYPKDKEFCSILKLNELFVAYAIEQCKSGI